MSERLSATRHHPLRWTATAALALLISLASIASAPATLDDLLFDLQFVPLDGRPAPAFTLSTLDGKDVALADLQGSVVLLYFWTSW